MVTEYRTEAIRSLSDMEHILHRTSAYIPDKGLLGQITICREIIDNSIDELELKRDNSGKLDVIMFTDRSNNSYSMIVCDNGRGIPVGPALIQSFASARTSGKFDGAAGFDASSGLFGQGSTVTLTLSSWFRVISLNTSIIGDVTLHRDGIPDNVNVSENDRGTTGTIVMFTPDTSIFTEIDKYILSLGNLTERLSQLSLFSKFGIRFYVVERAIAKLTKAGKIGAVLDYIDNIRNTDVPVFDNSSFDREWYIQTYFGLAKRCNNRYVVSGKTHDGNLTIDGEILILSGNLANNKLTFVNTILFTDNSSIHITLLLKFLKERISSYILDKQVNQFFVDHYKLPVLLILNIKYKSAQFSGFAKSVFKDLTIREPYRGLLDVIISHEITSSMYGLIKDHIETSYNRFSNKDFVVAGSLRNLMSRLNRPEKFNNCSTTDRNAAELFLVEGDSAKSDQDRNSIFQASYTLGGKPFNGLTEISRLGESANNIKKNHVFQDIIKILNITPGSSDLSNLNFGKTFIMADADTHGYHITNIVIGNLYALCPALINEGHVYITIPPLYSLNIKGNDPIYIRNTTELNATLAYHVYYRCLDITIKSDRYDHCLSREEFTAFSEIVIRIGGELDRLSTEYMIPAILLEQLSLLTSHLNLNNFDVNSIDQISRWLGYEVKYIAHGHLIIVSIGSDDIIVPLNQITELIYERILPLYREFYYGRTRIYATTKNSNLMKESPITIVMLNETFKKLANMFTIKRYKGLGSMPPADRSRNCMAPSTRRVFQITSIGDIGVLFDMLGTDPTERKRLVLK